jgi:hypothetical protein
MAFYATGVTQEIWNTFAEHYEITPIGAGRSHFKWTVAYEPSGLFRRLQFLAKPLMRLTFQRYLRNLQRQIRQRRG